MMEMIDMSGTNIRLENRQLKKQLTAQLKTLARVTVLLDNAALEAKRNITAADRFYRILVRNRRAVEQHIAKYR